jgi:hypothetical protein
MIVMCAASPNFTIAGRNALLLTASVAFCFSPVTLRLQRVANLFAKLKSSCENANSSEQIAFIAGAPGFVPAVYLQNSFLLLPSAAVALPNE